MINKLDLFKLGTPYIWFCVSGKLDFVNDQAIYMFW